MENNSHMSVDDIQEQNEDIKIEENTIEKKNEIQPEQTTENPKLNNISHEIELDNSEKKDILLEKSNEEFSLDKEKESNQTNHDNNENITNVNNDHQQPIKQKKTVSWGDTTVHTLKETDSKTQAQIIKNISNTLLTKMEEQAILCNQNLFHLTEKLQNSMEKIGNLTLENENIYSECVSETCSTVSQNIELSEELLKHCELLNEDFKPIYKLRNEIKDIHQTLTAYELSVYQFLRK